MKIIIEGKWGDDFPERMKGATAFEESIVFQVKRKLGLREKDEVIVKVEA